jgi:hypothetical protein
MNLFVREVTLAPEAPPHRRIKCLHGDFPGREAPLAWRHLQEQAIAFIENRSFSYFVQKAGRPIPLVVGQTASGEKFVKAQTDTDQPDTLLGLPVAAPPAVARPFGP